MLTKEEITRIIDKEENQKLFLDKISRAAKIAAANDLFSADVFYISVFGTFEVEEAFFSDYINAEEWLLDKSKEKKENTEFFATYLDGRMVEYKYNTYLKILK